MSLPPYPNSWYQVAWSRELRAGKLLPVRFCGRKGVAFRASDGSVAILDAFCPHLGADLGTGGKIFDDTVRCPFHHWRFDTAGQCVHVPYAKRIPSKARAQTYPACEANGIVFAYYHDQGAAPERPIEDVPEYQQGRLGDYLTRRRTVRSHIQELGENAADPHHIAMVHGPELEALHVEDHGAKGFHVWHRSQYRIFGRRIVTTVADLKMLCPGFAVTSVQIGQLGKVLQFTSGTPIDETSLVCHFSFARHPDHPRLFSALRRRLVAMSILWGFSQDIPIWENKKFLERPALCEADGLIGQFRDWYRRFYSEPESKGSRVATAGTPGEASRAETR